MAHSLIPVPEFSCGFTSSESLVLYFPELTVTTLADKVLQVHKSASRTPHPLVEPPPPSCISPIPPPFPPPRKAWEAFYPEGSINPSARIPGGFGFYLKGPDQFSLELGAATEAVFSYRMMLQGEWDWVKGGKLPGVYGGIGDLAYGCTGGRKENRCQCFNIRPMWRKDSIAELYTYLPLTSCNAKQLGAVPPLSMQNPDYGFSVGRGAFNLEAAVGNWVAIAFRIKLNDIGSENGELQLWVDGVSVISIDGLCFRESDESKIKGMHFQTFFGGHSEEWASPKDQRAWFADVTGVIVR
ncbi:hypothetical protein CVT24_011223 [Panaeolus cyanescens]|uniref:Polysaccharide lyase 14 domain-containing protein n=1 Tax=Panaeolus cyanescens TaxID=181874 RepID=A0A409YGE1_9AGAR|nr:hypothetical protein CVT24_011223 [Panaeolus cyanescens]